MKLQFVHFNTLLKRLGIILLVFISIRIIFYVFNYSTFGTLSLSEAYHIQKGGLIFDLSAIAYFNLAFIALSLLPIPLRQRKWYQSTLKIIFYCVNLFAIVIAISDISYYSFNNKRITADILALTDEAGKLFFQLIKSQWYLVVLFIITIFFIEFLYKKTTKRFSVFKENFFIQTGIFLISIFFVVIIIRGGFKGKILSPIMAMEFASIKKAPLVTNSPFTFIVSFSSIKLEEKNYFSPEKLKNILPLNKQYHNEAPVEKENVVIIILESFSSEFIGSLNNYKGYTPNLDSIIKHSLAFKNGTANAERSNKGVACILASLPSLMNEAFVSSPYQANSVTGLGTCLKEIGYNTSFFHGGTNGTMNFDQFTKEVGIDQYYGRSEFNNDKYFDGAWGIYDEEFLQYFAKHLNQFKQPFFSTIFTLSSHHPFPIPNKYKGKFPKGPSEVLESVGYADYALGRFFNTVSKQPWFKNTLFVITADHPFKVDEHFLHDYKLSAKMYGVPIIFYMPSKIKPQIKTEIANQIDILPSVLDHTGYPKSFNAFGSSVFSEHNAIGYQYRNELYQVFDSSNILYFNGSQTIGFFEYKNDTSERNNLNINNSIQQQKLENYTKALIQQYNSVLIHNTYSKQ